MTRSLGNFVVIVVEGEVLDPVEVGAEVTPGSKGLAVSVPFIPNATISKSVIPDSVTVMTSEL